MLSENELVMLVDRKGKKYIIELKKGKSFEFHKGKVMHDEILKKGIGERVLTSTGEELLILKPMLADFVLKKLKRASQIIYPKDIGQILVLADVFNAAKVLEVGTGSGALTLYLLKAAKGKVVSIDEREDMIKTATKNIEAFYGKKLREIKNLTLKKENLANLKEKGFDRIILDLPNPWDYLEKIKEILNDGGIVACWLPTVMQVFKLVDSIEKDSSFVLTGIYETLQREWQKRDIALRPKDRMIAHTGFLIVFRKIKSKR
jgi:tRNA (adenine57-N1/adenine58-N1)-methyltransferase